MNPIFNKDCESFLKLFVSFEKSLQDTTHVLSLDEILDELEVNLDAIIPFIYFQAYIYESGNLILKSNFSPDDIKADPSMLKWVIDNREITVIEKNDNDSIHDILYLPLSTMSVSWDRLFSSLLRR